MESTLPFVCYSEVGQAVSAKQRTLLVQSWTEIADIVHSIVLHRPPTPQISAWSLLPSKTRSSTMRWLIQAYCEPSFFANPVRHHHTSAIARGRKTLPICFPLCIYCRLMPASLGFIDTASHIRSILSSWNHLGWWDWNGTPTLGNLSRPPAAIKPILNSRCPLPGFWSSTGILFLSNGSLGMRE